MQWACPRRYMVAVSSTRTEADRSCGRVSSPKPVMWRFTASMREVVGEIWRREFAVAASRTRNRSPRDCWCWAGCTTGEGQDEALGGREDPFPLASWTA